MARSPGPDELARLPGVPLAAQADPRYLGDAAIRAYRDRPLADLVAALGWPNTTPAVTIAGGIGRATWTTAGCAVVESSAVRPASPPARPLVPVSADVIARRAQRCRDCEHYRAGTDQCGLCGCGFIVAERTRSPVATCPAGRW